VETSQRWYEQGLAFECTACGRCCTGASGYVWVAPKEAVVLARRLSLSLDDFGRRYLRLVDGHYALLDGPGGDCIFLHGKHCRVYEDRPMQCRTFPWWPANLSSSQSWRNAAEHCEGIRADAPVVGADQIERDLKRSLEAGLGEARQASMLEEPENSAR